jgi:hypothetical protein
MVLPRASQQIVFQELVDAISERERRRDRLEQQLDTLAPDWSGYPLAHLFVERLEMLTQTRYQRPKRGRQFILGVFKNVGQMAAYGPQALGDDQAEFPQ